MQSVKARLPDSMDMLPESSLDQREFAPERQTARRWRLTQLDYEELDLSGVEEDPKLQALRRLSQKKQKDGESPRRAQADVYGPSRQYMRMQEYSSDSGDFRGQDMVGGSGQSKQQEAASVGDAQTVTADDITEAGSDEEPKLQSPRRSLGQVQPKKLEFQRSLQADAYGPPMQYMRMQEYGSEVERREQDNSDGDSGQLEERKAFVADEDNAPVPDDNEESRQAEQLTTVDEFLGSGPNEARTRDVELVQEEEL